MSTNIVRLLQIESCVRQMEFAHTSDALLRILSGVPSCLLLHLENPLQHAMERMLSGIMSPYPLLTLGAHVGRDSPAGILVEEQLVLVLPDFLSGVCDCETHVYLLSHTHPASRAHRYIQAHASSVLSDMLPAVHSIPLLVQLVECFEGQKEEVASIHAHTEEVVCTCCSRETRWEVLARMLHTIPASFQARAIVVARMEHVARTTLPSVESWDTLARMRGDTDIGSVLEQMVEERMADVLPSLLPLVHDGAVVRTMRAHTSHGSRARRLLEEKLCVSEEVHAVTAEQVTLPRSLAVETVIDMDSPLAQWETLVRARELTAGGSYEELSIEMCMVNILPYVLADIGDDIFALLALYDTTFSHQILGSRLGVRVAELLPAVLPGIRGWDALRHLRDHTPQGTEARILVEAHMRQVARTQVGTHRGTTPSRLPSEMWEYGEQTHAWHMESLIEASLPNPYARGESE